MGWIWVAGTAIATGSGGRWRAARRRLHRPGTSAITNPTPARHPAKNPTGRGTQLCVTPSRRQNRQSERSAIVKPTISIGIPIRRSARTSNGMTQTSSGDYCGHQTSMEYAKPCINMRWGNARYSCMCERQRACSDPASVRSATRAAVATLARSARRFALFQGWRMWLMAEAGEKPCGAGQGIIDLARTWPSLVEDEPARQADVCPILGAEWER